jgi:hypothetical protein
LDNAELTKTGVTRILTKTGYTVDRCETLEERSELDQIDIECKLPDYLQRQVNRCNSHLKSFQLRLEMELPT